MKIRITGGMLHGRCIEFYKDEKVRPVQEILRLGVFNYIADFIHNANVLDLFAGSGVFGFEALSRGALKVTFVDLSSKNGLLVKKNAERLGVRKNVEFYKDDVISFLIGAKRRGKTYDIIFMDPPFLELAKMSKEQRDNYILEFVERASMVLNPRSLIVLKLKKDFELQVPTRMRLFESRNYGVNKVHYLIEKDVI